MQNNKKLFILIVMSFLISIAVSFQITENLDRYESDGFDHHIIKGDISDIWERGAIFKEDLISGKNFLVSGTEIYRSYLPPRLIGLFSIIFDYDLISTETEVKKISLGFKKFYYLFFQSLLFYGLLIYFYNNFSKFTKDSEVSFYTILFLCFCPNIFLYNSSYHTESIFFSFQILLMALLISPSKNFLYNFIVGLILSLIFLQKTAGIFYIFIVISYLIFFFKKESFKNISIILITFISVLMVIGISNFKRAGVFYFMPTQGNEAIYHYLAQPILIKGQNMTAGDASQKLNTDLEEWKIENKIEDEQLEKNRIQIMKFKKSYTLKLMQKNPIASLKIITWKALQTGILNPVYIFHYHYHEQDIYKKPPWYLEKDYLKFWIPFNITYSIIIYLIILLGFISSIKNLDIRYNLLILFSALYMFIMLGWVGNSRYFSPSLIYLSIYFGYGLNFIKNLILKEKYR
jgi:hypothetical protein